MAPKLGRTKKSSRINPIVAGSQTPAIKPSNPDAKVVAELPKKTKAYVGTPHPTRTAPPKSKKENLREKVASFCGPGTGSYGGTGGGGGMGGVMGGGGGGSGGGAVSQSSGGNFYSPELSTDFLQLPQSLIEQWNFYRFFYYNHPLVGRAIDTHVQLPLSKIRLSRPVCKDKALGDEALRFCLKWVRKVELSERLAEIVFNFFLIGEVFIFCEDTNPEMPEEISKRLVSKVDEDGEVTSSLEDYPDADSRTAAWMKKNYKGWTKIRVLPPEQVHIETFPFTDEIMVEIIPDAKTKYLIDQADSGDANAIRVMESMDDSVVMAVREGRNISLNTDPNAGSFIHYMSNKPSQYEPRGHGLLQRCLRTLVYSDMLRQAQNQIASRHMTPVRLVYADDMNEQQVEELRFQVDLALQDPDYSIITNFQVTWEEMNSNGRLLELSGEYDIIARELYAGLGVTESLLSGESSYAGDRINLEVLNTRYRALRDKVQSLVEKNFLEPMCRRMGFVEEDEDGDLVTVFPRVSFTRLALRDHQETFDALMQLYNKGSLDVETIYEVLNLDAQTINERLNKDFGTFSDASFNDMIRGLYGEIGRTLAERTNFVKMVAERLGLKYVEPPPEGGERF